MIMTIILKLNWKVTGRRRSEKWNNELEMLNFSCLNINRLIFQSFVLIFLCLSKSSSTDGTGQSHQTNSGSSFPIHSYGRQFGDMFNSNNFRILDTVPVRRPPPPPKPFIGPQQLNTSVFNGHTASLPCFVRNLGDRTISWLRAKDLHVLSSGPHVFTNDPRVVLTHNETKWGHSLTLNIKDIEKEDEGVYECQLNTEPKLTSTHYLHVLNDPPNDEGIGQSDSRTGDSPLASLDARVLLAYKGNMATILGQPRVYHRRGDIVNFTCIVPLQRNIMNISWFLNDIPIEKSSATHGGINIETQVYPQSIVSKLTIFRVFKRDEGKYSCGGLYMYPASVILIVNDDSRNEEKKTTKLTNSISKRASPSFQEIAISILILLLSNLTATNITYFILI